MKYKLNISNGCTAGGHLEVNGTATQRAEVSLKTLNLWKP